MAYVLHKVATADDVEKVYGIWSRNLSAYSKASKDILEGKYRWYYLESPAIQGAAWLIEDKDGVPVGAAGVGYRMFRVNGASVIFGLCSDLAVDPRHRTIGPSLMLMRSASQIEGRVGAVYGLPNKQAAASMKRAGFKMIGSLMRYALVLNAESVIKRLVGNPLVAKAIALPANEIIRLFSKSAWVNVPQGCTTGHVSVFDKRFDTLWEECSSWLKIACERDSVFLGWRYAECPLREYKTFCLFGPSQEVMGYIVYHLESEGAIAHIVDFLAGRPGWFETLFACLMAELRRAGVSTLSLIFFGGSGMKKTLANLGFMPRKETVPVMVRCGQVADQMLYQNEENWFLTSGDEDIN